MSQFSLSVLMYHYVRDPGDAAEAGTGVPGLGVAQFEAQLDDLARSHEILAWPDVRACLMAGQPLPARACLLTFDDGVRDHYLNVFPALRARGLSGLFFALAHRPGAGLPLPFKIHFLLGHMSVAELRAALQGRLAPARRQALAEAEARYRAAGEQDINVLKSALQRELAEEANGLLAELLREFVGREAELADALFLTPGQTAEMAAEGMHFGGHSQTHPWFDWVSAARQREEIAASAAWLRGFQPGPWAFAYPFGGVGAESPQLLQAGGFAAAFSTVPRTIHTDPLLIGRLDGETRLAWAA